MLSMKYLKAWLRSQKVSQAELARRLGTSRSTICHYLAGRKSPSVPVVKRLHKVTGITLERLMGP